MNDEAYVLPQVASEVAKAINKALSSVQTINGKKPDLNGNVEITTPDSSQNANPGGSGIINVPQDVKQAIKKLFQKAAYADADVSAELATIETWADTNATAISLDKTRISFTSVSQIVLTATLYPEDATDEIVWTSSDETVAIVQNGVVTAVANGNCTITATAGNLSASCAVSVSGVTASYSIKNALTNSVNSNNTAYVGDGDSYTANITAEEGYFLIDVVVTMGGEDITSTAYSNGIINIEAVTGNVTIYAKSGILNIVDVTWERGLYGNTGTKVEQRWYGAYRTTELIPMTKNQTIVLYSTDPTWTNNYTGTDGNGMTGPNTQCIFFASETQYINPTISINEEKSLLAFTADETVAANYKNTVGCKLHCSNLVGYVDTIVVGIVDA